MMQATARPGGVGNPPHERAPEVDSSVPELQVDGLMPSAGCGPGEDPLGVDTPPVVWRGVGPSPDGALEVVAAHSGAMATHFSIAGVARAPGTEDALAALRH